MFYEHVERTAASVQLQLTGRATNAHLSPFLSLSLSLSLSIVLFLFLFLFRIVSTDQRSDTRLCPLILTARNNDNSEQL